MSSRNLLKNDSSNINGRAASVLKLQGIFHDEVAQTSIKFKSQLNLRSKSFSCTFQVIFNVNLSVN
jgi:hypothetical protein